MSQLLIARDRCAKVTGEAPSITLCYEIGYDAFWLARFLMARGVECLVVDPASLKVDRRGRRAKTDRIDVGMLLRALIAWLRGDRHVWSVVRIPSVDEEDVRRSHRERGRLIHERTSPAVRPRHPRHQYQNAVQKAEARGAFDGRGSAIAVSAQSRDRAGDLTPCD